MNVIKQVIVTWIALATVFASGCTKFPELGNGYQFEYNAAGDISIVKYLKNVDSPTYFVYGHILAYTFDSTFIVVEERPRDSVPECTGKIPGMTKDRCDEAFANSTFSQYWIINKKEKPEFNEKTAVYSNVYGPYTKAEYLKARERLGLPKGLQIKRQIKGESFGSRVHDKLQRMIHFFGGTI